MNSINNMIDIANILSDYIIKTLKMIANEFFNNPMCMFALGVVIFSFVFRFFMSLFSYSAIEVEENREKVPLKINLEEDEYYDDEEDEYYDDEENEDYVYELLELKCDNCGALLDEKIINNGKCKCSYCGTSYLLNRKKV